VTFRRDGSVSSDVTIYISSIAGATNEFRAVTVTQSTGRVAWYRYTGSAWVAGNM
jgi:hypothetical protein